MLVRRRVLGLYAGFQCVCDNPRTLSLVLRGESQMSDALIELGLLDGFRNSSSAY